MTLGKTSCCVFLISTAMLAIAWKELPADETKLPAFGRDTVLVWNIKNANYSWDFVIRIAEFLPDRYLEWEESPSQGTIFMASRDVQEAQGYVNSQLFESGGDTRSKNVTTLWLSQRIYRDFKNKKRIKINLDGVPGLMTFEGTDQFTVDVNKTKTSLTVIKIKDERGSERWFLDLEENPLMVRHLINQYDQSLISITTNKSNTLRFIKGRKLANLPQ
jgi:hypothetical protein